MHVGPTKAYYSPLSTRVRLGNEDISNVDEFRYIGHIITAECWDDKSIEKLFRKKNTVGNMLIRKFSFAPSEFNGSSNIVTKFWGFLFVVIHANT